MGFLAWGGVGLVEMLGGLWEKGRVGVGLEIGFGFEDVESG